MAQNYGLKSFSTIKVYKYNYNLILNSYLLSFYAKIISLIEGCVSIKRRQTSNYRRLGSREIDGFKNSCNIQIRATSVKKLPAITSVIMLLISKVDFCEHFKLDSFRRINYSLY